MSLDQAITHGKEKRKNITVRKPVMRGAGTMATAGFAEEIASISGWLSYCRQKTRRKNERRRF